jgi:hypothetical protein
LAAGIGSFIDHAVAGRLMRPGHAHERIIMGKHDSSKTRVVPIFDQLCKNDRTGRSWLGKLISLPIGGISAPLPAECDFTIQDFGWGDREKKLDPPVALLSWLIRHPPRPLSGVLSLDPVKNEKRAEWIAGSEVRRLEALGLLRNNCNEKGWYIFEGPTHPDVFIQTPDVIVVIEGKRTESKPTTCTKWMAVRHQMLRHIDCAWEVAGNRKIIGFFIVEGQGADCLVPAAWIEYARQTVAPGVVASSLPHRGPEEQHGIASCFAGVATWQRLCKEFNLDWAALPDVAHK